MTLNVINADCEQELKRRMLSRICINCKKPVIEYPYYSIRENNGNPFWKSYPLCKDCGKIINIPMKEV